MLDLLTTVASHRSRCMPAVQVAVLIAALLPGSSAAAPRLSCEVSQGGETLTLAFSPVSDPYSVIPIDINRRFRFKAVMVGSDQKVDYIALYAYDLSSGQAVLLHEAKYLSPVPQRDATPDALTGKHYVYSSRRGRQMEYQCALAEVD